MCDRKSDKVSDKKGLKDKKQVKKKFRKKGKRNDLNPKSSNKSKKNHDRNPLNTITFLYSNIRSIKNKFTELETIVATESPDIIGITETWLDCENKEFISEFSLEGYTLINNDRKGRRGVGF